MLPPLASNIRYNYSTNVSDETNWLEAVRDAVFALGRSQRSVETILSKIRAIRPLTDGLATRVTCVSNATFPRGYSECSAFYLDARVALIVAEAANHESEYAPKMIVGLEFPVGGVAISQIQLATPKGNRFLFGLKPNYVEAVIRWVEQSFRPRNLYLIDGVEAVRRTLGSYACRYHSEFLRGVDGRSIGEWVVGNVTMREILDLNISSTCDCCIDDAVEENLSRDVAARMIGSYNRELSGYRDDGHTWLNLRPDTEEPGCEFRRLVRRKRRSDESAK